MLDLRALRIENNQVTDTDLAQLARLHALQTLDLQDTKVTDAGLASLARMTDLREITDAGLARIAKLTSLRSLVLYGSKITDAGLPVEHVADALGQSGPDVTRRHYLRLDCRTRRQTAPLRVLCEVLRELNRGPISSSQRRSYEITAGITDRNLSCAKGDSNPHGVTH